MISIQILCTVFFSVLIFVCDFHKFFLVNGNPNGRIVTIPQGQVKGRLSETRTGSFFMEYMGIPYVQPPKRFKTSRWPPPKWTGIRDGTQRPPPCYQTKGKLELGQEDCLFLNVATPANHNNFWILKDLPVMVIFHGGSWMIDRGDWNGGEGSQWGAKHMMDAKVVVVTVNYRLGVLGFFSTLSKEGPSNLGLKDQAMALKWIQENIANFGGDPNRVTICGQGSGAASVGLHLLSPMSKGLFHRAIMQSGSPLCHWALVDERGDRIGYRAFLEQLDCVYEQPAQVVECVSGKSAFDLESARQSIMQQSSYPDSYYPFGPVVEHWVRSVPKLKVFLADYPHNILLNSTNDTWGGIPIMMGVNSQDGLNFATGQYIYSSGAKDLYFNNYTKSYPPNFGYGRARGLSQANDEEGQNALTEKIRQFYYETAPVEAMKEKAYHNTHVNMYSHRNYFQCVKNAAVLYGKWSDIYLYYWSRTASSFKKWHDYDKLNIAKGVANGDEVHFMFDTADNYGDFTLIREPGSSNLKFSQNVVTIWVKFAADGKPVDDWKSMKGQGKTSLKWYELGDERKMGDEPFTKYADFWDSLGIDEPRELPKADEIPKKTFGGRLDKEDKGDLVDGFIYMDIGE